MLSLIFLTLTIASSTAKFDWSDCGHPNSTIRFSNIQMPDKITVRDSLTVTGKVSISQPIQNGTKLKLQVYRIFDVPWLGLAEMRMPCMFGLLCEHDVCQLIQNPEFGFICDLLKKHQAACKCPIAPSSIEESGLLIKLPDIVMKIVRTATKIISLDGTYRAINRIVDASGNQLGCLEIKRLEVTLNLTEGPGLGSGFWDLNVGYLLGR